MQQYHLYTARDFALDEYFQEWVLRPDVKNTYYWDTWLKLHPEKQEAVDMAIQLVKSIHFRGYQMTAADKEQLWENIWDSIAADDINALSSTPAPAASRFRIFSWKYAAAILLFILLGILWLFMRTPPFHTVTATVATQPGQTKRLLLPDSSEVFLNASSRLLYTQKERLVREVWLDGEAWFHVKHKEDNRSFIVHTYDHLSVEVLGTQFNVNNFGNKIAVVLQEGSIKLNITEQQGQHVTQLYLTPGEMLRYDKKDGDYSKSRTDAEKVTAWTHGQLIMDEYTVADAIQFMQQVFDRHVTIKDRRLLQYSVSGSMPIIYNADTMLMQFEKAFNVRFDKRDDTNHVREN
ncbi:FecR domain-containing protein [Chitinophaga filiformis]|uniref:FecR family protein n=1 Tax=Chitinophaga filiformis TaxID=104663 RepID=UPI001F46FC40|nr:FecR domain-containing protein [Chitinophaga filiformis]MCF6402874.1 FecR domain-containing protein [Chitinophaga filiformis]MCF6403208.1 FecR domain-containing protein [Chitinophaga filiformis]